MSSSSMPSSSAPAGAWSEPYPQEAFDFVSEGLTHTVSLLHDQPTLSSSRMATIAWVIARSENAVTKS